jgi:hypothetical protein
MSVSQDPTANRRHLFFHDEDPNIEFILSIPIFSTLQAQSIKIL